MPLLLLQRFLPKTREGWQVLVIIVLLAACSMEATVIIRQQGQLAEAPKVETHEVVRTRTVVTQGPERVVERVVYKPGGIRYVERSIERESKVTQTGVVRDENSSSTPVGPSMPTRFVGVMLAPDTEYKAFGVRGGMTLFNSLDLGIGYRFAGPWHGAQADLSYRF